LPAALGQTPDSFGHEHHDQYHRDAIRSHVNFFQKAQPLRQQDQQDRTDCRAKRRLRAAQERHGQEFDRDFEVEVIRTDVREAGCVKRAAHTSQPGAQHKGNDLDSQSLYARHFSREFVFAYCAHGAAKACSGQIPDEQDRGIKNGDAKHQINLVIRQLIAKQGRPGNARDAVRAARDCGPVDQHQIKNLLKTDGDHGEVMPAQPQRRQSQHQAGKSCNRYAQQQRHPKIKAQNDGSQRYRIRSQTKKCRLRQVDLSGIAQHDGHAQYGDAVGHRLHENIQHIGIDGEEKRNRRQHQRKSQQ